MRVCKAMCLLYGFKYNRLKGVDKCVTCDLSFTLGQFPICPCCGNKFRKRAIGISAILQEKHRWNKRV